MTTEEKKEILAKVFTPSSPIKEKEFFFGRKYQLELVCDAINSTGQHAVLYGERGVGKTSLSIIMSHAYTNIHPIRIICNDSSSFEDLWKNAFSNIKLSKDHQGIGFTQETVQEIIKAVALYNPRNKAEELTLIIDILKILDKQKLLIIFDEFDRIKDPYTKSQFA